LEEKLIWKSRIALLCLIGMLVGMMGARALASISMMLFGLNAIWDVHPKKWLKNRWWLFGCGWIALYLISYFWSSDKEQWWEHTQVKMPFLLLPLAFDLLPPFCKIHKTIFTAVLAVLMLGGAAFSLSYFFQNPEAFIHSYKYAQVIPTPFYNDHIAYSTAVAVSIAWMIFFLPQLPRALYRWLLAGSIVLLIIYLHILAAKTGLVAFYVLVLAMIIKQIIHKPLRGIILAMATISIFVAAALFVPTLRERIGYSMVTWRSFGMGERNGIYSDANRIISYDVALHSIAKHPIAGVGVGDVFQVMKEGYQKHYPEVAEEQQLWPHNQFLTTAVGIGIPGACLLLCWLLAALRRIKGREGFYFFVVWTMLLVPLMVDPFLEVQMGVAVYLVFLLWQRKSMKDAAVAAERRL
jgi:O-antigen ligase